MRILVTNDDGLQAAQLIPLIRWCRKLGDVTAVVPKYEQSGKSHGIEIHRPIEARQVELASDISVWSVDSTPADCVRFAILGLKLEFDLVISGVNRGLNIGTDIMYSGTVGAAFEAAFLGMKALAISTPPEFYEYAIEHLDRIFTYIEQHNLLSVHSLYNINIPFQAEAILITRQGGPYYSDEYHLLENDMYRPVGHSIYQDRGDNTLDTDAVMHGYISITPLTIERTDQAIYSILKQK